MIILARIERDNFKKDDELMRDESIIVDGLRNTRTQDRSVRQKQN